MELQKDLISFLQYITNSREVWCGDYGVYTPQLISKRVRYLLKSLQDLPPNTRMHVDTKPHGHSKGFGDGINRKSINDVVEGVYS